MAVLGVDDFKSKLRGGGARPNLFKATINFPAYADGDAELTSFLCETAQLPGSNMGTIIVPFRGRQLKWLVIVHSLNGQYRLSMTQTLQCATLWSVG